MVICSGFWAFYDGMVLVQHDKIRFAAVFPGGGIYKWVGLDAESMGLLCDITVSRR